MTAKATHRFPQGFLWGCATASHQVEGQINNQWTRWEQTAGRIFQNQTADRACEWWKGRWEEDFDRAADMHNNAQRLSVEWSRIEPQMGVWDKDALDRYRQMANGLRLRGMAPMITLHHFTLPLWADDQGGWLWDELPARFATFAEKVVTALGDVCSLWCTINEPMVLAVNGYLLGEWPPGNHDLGQTARVSINLLRAHAAAYHAIKAVQPHSQIGFGQHRIGVKPLPPVLINQIAGRVIDYTFNNGFLLALRDGKAKFAGARAVSLPEIKNTLDWVGVQYYADYHPYLSLRAAKNMFMVFHKPEEAPKVEAPKWGAVNPAGIFDHLKWLTVNMKLPIYITESGVPDADDTVRPGFLVETLHTVWKAVGYNFPIKGYFFWSLVDNFEWVEGFDPRYKFGLYSLDVETQVRTPRQSALLYGEICAQNGLAIDVVQKYAPALAERLFPGEPGNNNVKLTAHP